MEMWVYLGGGFCDGAQGVLFDCFDWFTSYTYTLSWRMSGIDAVVPLQAGWCYAFYTGIAFENALEAAIGTLCSCWSLYTSQLQRVACLASTAATALAANWPSSPVQSANVNL